MMCQSCSGLYSLHIHARIFKAHWIYHLLPFLKSKILRELKKIFKYSNNFFVLKKYLKLDFLLNKIRIKEQKKILKVINIGLKNPAVMHVFSKHASSYGKEEARLNLLW